MKSIKLKNLVKENFEIVITDKENSDKIYDRIFKILDNNSVLPKRFNDTTDELEKSDGLHLIWRQKFNNSVIDELEKIKGITII